MSVRIGINGFGRIGRNFFRAVLEQHPGFEIVAVNDLTENSVLAHLLKHDTVLGRLGESVEHDDTSIIVGGRHVTAMAEADPSAIRWGDLGVDIVIESTGRFTSRDAAAKHLDGGARKVILSAPAKGDIDGTFVMGVNHHTYDPETQHVLSNSSCTTNCIAPLAKIFNDAFGIESGLLTTIHAYTADQNLQDGPHRDLRRARAAAENIIPTSTGAARSIGLVLPELAGKLDGFALRVPVPVGSITDLTVVSSKPVTADEVKAAYRAAAGGPLNGIVSYTEDEIVSSDIVGDTHSAIFDAGMLVVNGSQVKLSGWYDNEWGYSSRLADFTQYVAERL